MATGSCRHLIHRSRPVLTHARVPPQSSDSRQAHLTSASRCNRTRKRAILGASIMASSPLTPPARVFFFGPASNRPTGTVPVEQRDASRRDPVTGSKSRGVFVVRPSDAEVQKFVEAVPAIAGKVRDFKDRAIVMATSVTGPVGEDLTVSGNDRRP